MVGQGRLGPWRPVSASPPHRPIKWRDCSTHPGHDDCIAPAPCCGSHRQHEPACAGRSWPPGPPRSWRMPLSSATGGRGLVQRAYRVQRHWPQAARTRCDRTPPDSSRTPAWTGAQPSKKCCPGMPGRPHRPPRNWGRETPRSMPMRLHQAVPQAVSLAPVASSSPRPHARVGLRPCGSTGDRVRGKLNRAQIASGSSCDSNNEYNSPLHEYLNAWRDSHFCFSAEA